MKIRLGLLLIGIASALALTGCGSVEMERVAPTIYKFTPGAGSLQMNSISQCKGEGSLVNIKELGSLSDIATLASQRKQLLEGMKKSPLHDDKVTKALINEITRLVIVAHRDIILATEAGNQAQLDMQTKLLADTLRELGPQESLDADDFKVFAERVADTALNPSIAATLANDADGASFWSDLVEYYSAYYEGKFVDHFGNQLPKPELSRTIGNDQIAGALTVFIELLADKVLKTPVWKDAQGNYFPGEFPDKPTAASLGVVDTLDLLNDENSMTCGITRLKAKAINFLAHTAGDRAGELSGLISGSFGGVSIGLGILGKLSIGDNQTLQVIIKTAFSQAFTRGAEEASYRILYWIGYAPKGSTHEETKISDLVRYVSLN